MISSAPKSAPDNQPKPTSKLDPGKTYVVTMKTNCGTLHVPDRPGAVAERLGVVREPRPARVLRQHGLPPDRAGLRDPGRRPDRHGHAAARATRRSTRRRRARATRTASSRWRRRRSEAPGTAGSQFFVVTVGERGPPARLRDHRQGDEGPRCRRPDRPARRRAAAADADRRDRVRNRRRAPSWSPRSSSRPALRPGSGHRSSCCSCRTSSTACARPRSTRSSSSRAPTRSRRPRRSISRARGS